MCAFRLCNASRSVAGFTIVEALAALAIATAMLAAIGSLMSTSIKGARRIDDRMVLVETARTLAAALPPRGDATTGVTSGELNGIVWRVDISPLLRTASDKQQWVPKRVRIQVKSSAGTSFALETARLGRRSQ
ncbi:MULTISPECIES: general secretion pathway protein GspI [Bradyrhizobium]|uniref:General secretion pathway protein GspI n=3 Tax=Bradyrhizobium TaxID=374 RepID=A0AAE6CCL8_9BRAD|nr:MULTISPECIES: general secretion pathway protein GspI [Bradyrhizobium]MCG2628168.1 general secretion pathway protein GspI [Bradyrhizobium zhengyangense]MCG2643287.1 general secretion pathway protein GspI [Bradyrhizobium zhengyangense]MCG2670399.1 general secretion pathway protein GspI [Bradyrhizobium zhengyangense]MDN4985866.1 general secretion pathway protein GspI [Bradyrhizobium sp. WYCCWR 13022]MDN5002755.1 general secretion pathway protein GspI [Bradyrhizobium sp. WYCCWR 12677]